MNNLAPDLEDLLKKAMQYVRSSFELIRLQSIEKISDLISSFACIVLIVLLVTLFGLFLNIGLALYLGKILGETYFGFLVVAGIYLLFAILFFVFRKQLILSPLTDLVISKLLKKKS